MIIQRSMEGKINGCESFRDASFSYLRSDQKPTASARTSKATAVAGEAEISVFGAERYFNTPLQPLHTNSNSDRRRESQGGAGEDNGDEAASVATVRPGTPSACSEGSRSTAMLLKSSSAALRRSLSSSQRNHHRRQRRRQWLLEGSRSFFSTLGCTGSCTDEKSVVVADPNQGQSSLGQDQNHHQSRRFRYEARSTKRAEDHFAFPILNSSGEESKKPPPPPPDDPPRMSLEVFGSKEAPLGVVDEVAAHLERKLSVLTWDAIPASVPPKPSGYGGGSRVSPKTSRGGGGDDIDSDASSDLFEIENITANRRGYAEPAAVVSARNSGYEPSEASIDWSVVTASAAADVADPEQYDEKKISAKAAAAKRRPGIGMLGCKTQKSVRVAENASRTTVYSKEDS